MTDPHRFLQMACCRRSVWQVLRNSTAAIGPKCPFASCARARSLSWFASFKSCGRCWRQELEKPSFTNMFFVLMGVSMCFHNWGSPSHHGFNTKTPAILHDLGYPISLFGTHLLIHIIWIWGDLWELCWRLMRLECWPLDSSNWLLWISSISRGAGGRWHAATATEEKRKIKHVRWLPQAYVLPVWWQNIFKCTCIYIYIQYIYDMYLTFVHLIILICVYRFQSVGVNMNPGPTHDFKRLFSSLPWMMCSKWPHKQFWKLSKFPETRSLDHIMPKLRSYSFVSCILLCKYYVHDKYHNMIICYLYLNILQI